SQPTFPLSSQLFTSSFLIPRPPPRATLFPYTTLFRSRSREGKHATDRLANKIQMCLHRKVHHRLHDVAFSKQRNQSLSLSKLHRSEEHTSELQSRFDLVCRLLLEKKKKIK